jgi:YVTN family beta-propeller protein
MPLPARLRDALRTLIAPGIFLLTASAAVDGATLVVANKAEATASLIDLASGEVVATLPTENGPHEVGISPDGRFALVTNYGQREAPGRTLTLIDIPEARVEKTIDLGPHERPHGVEWIDGMRAAVTVEDSRALAIVDVTRGSVTAVIGTDQDISHMVALDAARQRAYVTSIGSGSVTIIDLAAGKRLRNLPTGEGAEGVAVPPGGQQVWVTNRAADTLTVLDTESFEVLAELPAAGFPIRATATPAGQILVTRARAGDLMILDADRREETRTVAFDIETMDVDDRLFGDRFGDSSVPIGVVADDTGKFAYVAHANADVITEIELDSGAITRILRAGREPDGMGYSPLAASP